MTERRRAQEAGGEGEAVRDLSMHDWVGRFGLARRAVPWLESAPATTPATTLAATRTTKLAITFAITLAITLAMSASAVVIAGPDGSLNTSAPIPDPGFANVGDREGLSGVYLRNGWVLTANHVGVGPIDFDGTTYQPIPGSGIRLTNPDATNADLLLFKLLVPPPVPDAILPSTPVSVGDELVLIGNGLSRGGPTTLVLDPGPPVVSVDGWFTSQPRVIRWGTNTVSGVGQFELNTHAFSVLFDELSGPSQNDPEAQAVDGDSGGAAFRWTGGTPELVGILFARQTFGGQDPGTALFFNRSLMVDLEVYLADLVAIIDQAECDNGVDDDGDGQIDFPADVGCVDALDPSEVPEPGFAVALMVGTGALVARSARPSRRSRRDRAPRSIGRRRARRSYRSDSRRR